MIPVWLWEKQIQCEYMIENWVVKNEKISANILCNENKKNYLIFMRFFKRWHYYHGKLFYVRKVKANKLLHFKAIYHLDIEIVTIQWTETFTIYTCWYSYPFASKIKKKLIKIIPFNVRWRESRDIQHSLILTYIVSY